MSRSDVQAVVEEIAAEAQRRRSSGEIPPDLLARLSSDFDASAEVDVPEEFAVLQSARPLHSDRSRLGSHIVRGKRVMRRLLAWYIQPITEDQTRFNLAILRQLRELEQRVRWLEPPLESTTDASDAALADHARTIAALLAGGRGLRVIGGDAALCARLGEAGVAGVTAVPWDQLAGAALSSLPAVMFADCLDRMTAAQLGAALPLAAAGVEVGGRVIVDNASGGAVDDTAVVRRLSTEQVAGLVAAAGFDDIEVVDAPGRLVVTGRRRGG